MGVSQDIQQGEGGEQGDSLMPMLFDLGHHRALLANRGGVVPQDSGQVVWG